MVQKDTQFVMKNNQVQQPFIPTDGLELYYDVKGKKNTDNYKDKLLDMSGNGRHGVLSNFAYEGVSGYRGTTEGGLLLDDVDDKIFRPAIDGVEYTSASRNLFNEAELTFPTKVINNESYWIVKGINDGGSTSITIRNIFKQNTQYTVQYLGVVTTYFNMLVFSYTDGTKTTRAFTDGVLHNYTSLSGKTIDYITIDTGSRSADGYIKKNTFQLEQGVVATPYTPYIPLPIMTYQMNGNILSFEKDGTVKRTTKDANGNEVVVSRKGINLIRNGNFANETIGWYSSTLKSEDGVLTSIGNGVNSTIDTYTRINSSSRKGDIVYRKVYARVLDENCLELRVNSQENIDGQQYVQANIKTLPVKNEWYLLEIRDSVFASYTGLLRHHWIRASYSTPAIQKDKIVEIKEAQFINLTEAYGAGSEPDLAYIQSHPEEFAWTPNPNDLIETVEIKNNLVGDLENLQGNDFEQHEDGVITYTNEAEEGSVVRVDIDGASFQDVGSGKNIFYKNEVYSKDSEINDDCINISIGDRFFYPIDGVSNAQYTTSFDYERDNTTTPVSMSFYYTDGTSDENSQIMSSSDRVRLTLSSTIGKTVSGVGYNPPVVLGCSWKKISNPTMERTGLAIDTAQEDESLGVRWNKLQNPIMERV